MYAYKALAQLSDEMYRSGLDTESLDPSLWCSRVQDYITYEVLFPYYLTEYILYVHTYIRSLDARGPRLASLEPILESHIHQPVFHRERAPQKEQAKDRAGRAIVTYCICLCTCIHKSNQYPNGSSPIQVYMHMSYPFPGYFRHFYVLF